VGGVHTIDNRVTQLNTNALYSFILTLFGRASYFVEASVDLPTLSL